MEAPLQLENSLTLEEMYQILSQRKISPNELAYAVKLERLPTMDVLTVNSPTDGRLLTRLCNEVDAQTIDAYVREVVPDIAYLLGTSPEIISQSLEKNTETRKPEKFHFEGHFVPVNAYLANEKKGSQLC